MVLHDFVFFPADCLHSTRYYMAYQYSIPHSVRFIELLLLSEFGQSFQHMVEFIDSKVLLSHDVLNPARVPL